MTENFAAQAQDEVVDICRDLIRIDTTNPGDHSGPGERRAAEYVAGLLSEVGLQPTVLESHPKRTSLVARVEGKDPSRPALLIHGHLDVVPANALDWRRDPFAGEIADGCVWGRGAVDMKDMDAMVLAVVRKRMREGRKPDRDVVLAFTADEEAGGNWGAKFLVEEHPDLFEGVTEAIGEVGGFSVSVGDERIYAVQTAEKGLAWMRLTATGTAGHGSMIHSDNAITALAAAVARIGQHQWPTQLPDATKAFLSTGEPGPEGRVRPAGPGQHHRQARRDEQDDRRDHPAHREPDRPQGRIQGECDPADSERGPRRALPARPRGRVLRATRRTARKSSDSASSSTTTSRSRPPPTATSGTRWPPP